MEVPILERMRLSLSEKRDELAEWLRRTPAPKKDIWLGTSSERAVQDHLGALGRAIAQAEAGTLGQCEVCHEPVDTDLLEVDYLASVCIEHFSEEEVRQLETELELAQSVQRTLLPQEAPKIPGLEVAAFSRPAQIVGGDYFDFIEFGSGKYGLVVADVAGHGVSSSLHMASIQAILRAIVPLNRSPADVLTQLQRLFVHNIRFSTFVSCFLGAFDPRSKRLTYCNAGHNPPLLLGNRIGAGSAPAWLRPTGPAIGLVEGAQFSEDTRELRTGDLLVLYTDGLTEAVSPTGEEFGSDRLLDLIRGMPGMPVRDLVREIRQGLERFSEGRPFADDTTVVVCKVN